MTPDAVVLTIQIDLGDYQFKHLRLSTKYDKSRLDEIRAEAIKLVKSLDYVISFEIGEIYQVQGPKDEELPDNWYDQMEEFLKEYPSWEYDALWEN